MFHMLINFSNHPSLYWSEKQIEDAQLYGEITDIPFPDVSPIASHEELLNLAQDFVQKIVSIADSRTVTVHVMGEMTFTFMVVTKLKELGIKCVASTTERKTTYNSDGVKLSEFSFVQFREY